MGILKETFKLFLEDQITCGQMLLMIEEFDIGFETSILIFSPEMPIGESESKRELEPLAKRIFSKIKKIIPSFASSHIEKLFDKERIIGFTNQILMRGIKDRVEQIIFSVSGDDFQVIFLRDNLENLFLSFPAEIFELISARLKEMVSFNLKDNTGICQIKIEDLATDIKIEFFDQPKKIVAAFGTPTKI